MGDFSHSLILDVILVSEPVQANQSYSVILITRLVPLRVHVFSSFCDINEGSSLHSHAELLLIVISD